MDAAARSPVPPGLLDRLGQLVPRLAVERSDQATHFAPLERPEAVGRALGAFCRELL